MTNTKKVKLPKSAVTGRIVTSAYAKAHPNTTVFQTVVKKQASGKKK
ncbi:MAG: hypothetical protein WC045_03265 [Patescibacteria group bacterium]